MRRSSKTTLKYKPLIVTYENFNRAESHLYFKSSIAARGAGRFHRLREMLPIRTQRVIRGNCQTLYSSGVFDLDAGRLTIILPDSAGRFISMIAIDEEHYALETVYGQGKYTYSRRQVGTRYVFMGIRTFADLNDPKDLVKVDALQNAIRAEQKAGGTFEFPAWDPKSHNKVRDELIRRAANVADTKSMFGPRGKVDPELHLIGSATGWGGTPPEDCFLSGNSAA